jgi:hypothetical protein
MAERNFSANSSYSLVWQRRWFSFWPGPSTSTERFVRLDSLSGSQSSSFYLSLLIDFVGKSSDPERPLTLPDLGASKVTK